MEQKAAQQKDPDLLKVEERFGQSQSLLHHEGAGFLFSKLLTLSADSKIVESPLFSFVLRAACNKQPSIADPCLSVVIFIFLVYIYIY